MFGHVLIPWYPMFHLVFVLTNPGFPPKKSSQLPPFRQESEALLCNTQHSVASLPGADLRLLNCVVEACAKERRWRSTAMEANVTIHNQSGGWEHGFYD